MVQENKMDSLLDSVSKHRGFKDYEEMSKLMTLALTFDSVVTAKEYHSWVKNNGRKEELLSIIQRGKNYKAQQTATFVKDLKDGWDGDARLYKLSSRIAADEKRATRYVVVSCMARNATMKTSIFPSESNGEPINYAEMKGSLTGELNHKKALEYLGFNLIDKRDV